MAHQNIEERQQAVWAFLETGMHMGPKEKAAFAARFCCSTAAIVADVLIFFRPKTKETRYVNPRIKRLVRQRDAGKCQYCEAENTPTMIIEHVIPASIGGVGKPFNLVLACSSCNSKKSNTVWIPRNFDAITRGHAKWKAKAIQLLHT